MQIRHVSLTFIGNQSRPILDLESWRRQQETTFWYFLKNNHDNAQFTDIKKKKEIEAVKSHYHQHSTEKKTYFGRSPNCLWGTVALHFCVKTEPALKISIVYTIYIYLLHGSEEKLQSLGGNKQQFQAWII